MSTYVYEMPDFLSGQSVDEIQGRMLALLPSDIDKSENSIPWDFTRPPALEKAQLVQFELNETIKLMFPQWAYGSWLDYHGQIANVVRKEANHSMGVLSVTGILGTVIPKGFVFATASGLTASVLFQTLEEVTLEGNPDASGRVCQLVEVESVVGGVIGNVAVDTVKLMSTPLSGITHVTNLQVFSGGTAEESDDDFRTRILENLSLGSSYTGCNADYVRWSKEISGVGYAMVEPEWNDPSLPESFHYINSQGKECCAGAVRLIIADENGSPANDQILERVYDHIMGEGATDLNRLAPVGAHLTVIAPESVYIHVTAELLLEDGVDLEVVRGRILSNLAEYWLEVATEAQSSLLGVGTIRYVQVGAMIAKTLGILDYQGLVVNGLENENIVISQTSYPVTGEVDLTVY